MSKTFARLHPRLQDAIVARLGWTSLRPVQDDAGAALLDGQNAVVLAPTAGGKTEAAIFPLLSSVMASPAAPGATALLYVAPIKALLNNQAERLHRYTEMVGLRRMVWHGDATQGEKRRFLAQPAELLMTTPESLEVMLISSRVPVRSLFADLRAVVIDEVHALAGTDRGAHLMCVVERLAALSRHDVQRVGLSATVGNPRAILGWLTGSSARDGQVVDPPKPPARRELKIIHRPDVPELARDVAKVARGAKSLLFCESRATTEAVAQRMRAAGTDVFVHHSAVSFEERSAAEERFHRGSDACIVCTSTLELGIDVGDLDRVYQVDAPSTVSAFLQRMGRTGRRAGTAANTTFFCQDAWTVAQAVALVELAREGWVERVALDDRCWPVLVHQLIAMSLADGAVDAGDAWALLSRVRDVGGIRQAEFEALIEHLVAEDFLFRDERSRLSIGDRAERVFGRKNFLSLYAVFSSPQSYTVVSAADRAVGTLYQDFVDRLVEDASCFLLAGRAWLVHHIDHGKRRVRVTPAPRGRKPSWTGYVPQFLDYDLCQRVRGVVVGDEAPAYLHRSATDALRSLREDLGALVREGDGELRGDGHVAWWTFAGGRINSTIKHALHALGDWKIVTDNYLVRVEDAHLDLGAWRAARARLRDPEFWSDDATWDAIRERLPAYRLSKFQAAMPDAIQREVLSSYLLDPMRAEVFCRSGVALAQ